MVDEKYVELMQKEIDGDISYFEKARLANYLKGNEEARDLRKSLREIHQCLIEEPLIESPKSLRENVMRQVMPRPRPTINPLGSRQGVWESLVARFKLQPAIPFAVGVAMGVLALVPVISQNQEGARVDTTRLIGTLLNSDLDTKVIDHKQISFGLVKGGVEVRTFEGWVLVDVALMSPDQVSLVLNYDTDDIAFYGLTNIDRGATFVETSDRELRLTHTGIRHYYLAFTDNPDRVSEIAIRVEAGGEAYEESIHTGPVAR